MNQRASIVNLRDSRDQAHFHAFVELYTQTFTDPEEREDPAQWPGRMWVEAPAPQPQTHVLVVLSAVDQSVVGGLVFEHYRGSHCGLLTYLVVAEAWRKQGIARALIQQAIDTLVAAERAAGTQLRAVFCETVDPRLEPQGHAGMAACDRLRTIVQLGARMLNLKYVQPALTGGSGPCGHLLLLRFDLRGYGHDIDADETGTEMPAAIVHDFLHEFYRALAVAQPEDDPHFSAMRAQLRGATVGLHDPREHPVLALQDTAVCLHFVSSAVAPPEQALAYPASPVFQSMELDLMSYGFQVQQLLGSQCECFAPIATDIVFPAYLNYRSEGRDMLLLRGRARCRAQVYISSTRFLVSGLCVWHVVLVPAPGESFSEYDIIKLIHLYDGRTENTGLGAKILFRVRAGEADEREVRVAELLPALLNRPAADVDATPRAGTIQMLLGDAVARDGTDLAEIMAVVQTARGGDFKNGGKQAYDKLIGWVAAQDTQGRVLLALCGIVTGIFDFVEIGEEEVLDTMEPIFASPGSMIYIHRCTLINIAEEDRAMEAVRHSVGISPYLLLPHAALLHNEALIEDSERELARSTSGKRHKLPALEAAYHHIERNLNRFYLPNVFNYVTERTLFADGAQARGTNERLAAARAKLDELDGQVKAGWGRRYDRGQLRIAALLAVFAVIGVRDEIFDLLQGTPLEAYSWQVLFGIAGCLVLLYLIVGVKRSSD